MENRNDPVHGKRHGATTMFKNIIQVIPRSVRTLLAPRYRPERHYMRGYGPACAARAAAEH